MTRRPGQAENTIESECAIELVVAATEFHQQGGFQEQIDGEPEC
jgi:hypothetical protein